MGENMRYFMYKYDQLYDDWFNDLNNIYILHNITKLDDSCVDGAVRELCEARDSGLPQFADSNQLTSMIDLQLYSVLNILLMYIYKYYILQTI